MDTIKFKAIQDRKTKEISLYVLRPVNEKEWMVIDRFNKMDVKEFKYLGDFIHSIFNKK
jgi:hypothetical protein